MSEDNEETKGVERAGEVAKNIWLAGLGAYGKAFDEAQDRYEKVSKETSRLFDDLVAKGKKLEDDTQGKFSTVKEKSNATIEERVSKVRHALGFTEGPKSGSIAELSKKVDELSEKIDLVIEALGAKAKTTKTKASRATAKATKEDTEDTAAA